MVRLGQQVKGLGDPSQATTRRGGEVMLGPTRGLHAPGGVDVGCEGCWCVASAEAADPSHAASRHRPKDLHLNTSSAEKPPGASFSPLAKPQ